MSATSQMEMFPREDGSTGTDPVQGLSVELPDKCPNCYGVIATVGPGREPHKASLRCTTCGRHRGWLSLQTWSFIHELAAKVAAPMTPIKIRRGSSVSDQIES